MRERTRRLALILGGLTVVLCVVAAARGFAWRAGAFCPGEAETAFVRSFLPRDAPERHGDILTHFKYGSIGSEACAGIPFWIWLVLPSVFAEHLPDRPGEGYARIGFIYEPGEKRPIGTSYRERPFGQVGLNCAVCHTGTLRDTPDSPPRIVLGMPAQQMDLQRYFNFLFASARDDRFNADTMLAAMHAEKPGPSWLEGLLYRYFIIPQTRDRLREAANQFAWADRRPPLGPGRVDTFNPYKALFFNFDMAADDSIGTADLPSLWNQSVREKMWLHWDGNNNSVDERNKSAAIGAGASPESLDHDSLDRVARWIWDLPPPQFPGMIDSFRAESGRLLYRAHCAECHALDGRNVGQVTPIQDVRTDRERLDSFTQPLADRMRKLGEGYPWQFSHFRKTDGYTNALLDGIWLRAPYLHNGSVPTLRDLLRLPEERPTIFYRGYDVYDYLNLGFVSTGSQAQRSGERYDTNVRGNRNQGHVYGTQLSSSEIADLLEFLKTQ